MQLSCACSHEAKAQMRHREYENIAFCSGESIEQFVIWLQNILNDLDLLGPR
jgi:hypothetical protein